MLASFCLQLFYRVNALRTVLYERFELRRAGPKYPETESVSVIILAALIFVFA